MCCVKQINQKKVSQFNNSNGFARKNSFRLNIKANYFSLASKEACACYEIAVKIIIYLFLKYEY